MISTLILIFAFSNDTPSTKVMVFEDAGFKLVFPAEWQVRTSDVGAHAGIAELPPRRALTMVTRIPTAGKTAGQLIESYLQGMEDNFEEHELIANKKITLENGTRAHLVHLRGTNHDHALRHLTYLVSAPTEHISVTFATEDESFDELLPQFSSIMRTLVFTGPPDYEETWAFLRAIEKKPEDRAELERLLGEGADIDGVNERGVTAFFLALGHRDGHLVRWLFDKGLDLKDPRHNTEMVINLATPPIRRMIDHHLGVPPKKHGKPVGLEIQWVSKEAELFAGIMDAREEYVRGAIEKGVDLGALEPTYQLAALPLTRKLIEEFEDLSLDAAAYRAIEKILVEATRPGQGQ